MAASKAKIVPPTKDEVESARQELCRKLETAENQPLSKKRNATIVFAEKREVLEGLLIGRV